MIVCFMLIVRVEEVVLRCYGRILGRLASVVLRPLILMQMSLPNVAIGGSSQGFMVLQKKKARRHAWELLKRLHSNPDVPWVCGGDFNEILNPTEVAGGVSGLLMKCCCSGRLWIGAI